MKMTKDKLFVSPVKLRYSIGSIDVIKTQIKKSFKLRQTLSTENSPRLTLI